MATTTTRLGLRKPDGTPVTGDTVDVSLDINGSMDKIDAAIGFAVCTSGTRPGSPWQGQPIYETDTGKAYVATVGGGTPTWTQLLLGTALFGTINCGPLNAGAATLGNTSMGTLASGNQTVTGTVVASSTVTGSNFIIASGSRSVSGELDALKDPNRLYIVRSAFAAPHNSTSDVTGWSAAIKNVGSFTFTTATGIWRVPVTGDYRISVRIGWGSPSGSNTGATDLYININGSNTQLSRIISRGTDGGKVDKAVWEGALTAGQDIKFQTFQNANGGATLNVDINARIVWVGP